MLDYCLLLDLCEIKQQRTSQSVCHIIDAQQIIALVRGIMRPNNGQESLYQD